MIRITVGRLNTYLADVNDQAEEQMLLLMKQMAESDNAWLFSDIKNVVEECFYAVQNAWTNLNMAPAAPYMTENLMEEWQTKLNWMKHREERNVLENIQLLKALPVAVYDDTDNTKDQIWFYIKGKMVDYTINESTRAKISGSRSPASFVEYWQFVRRDGQWVLNRVLQKNESGQIDFSE
jgi:predicted lipid-binding transport protein (Tim44 family)